MAIKKIQIKPPNNNYADVIHPETDVSMVLSVDGTTPLSTSLATMQTQIDGKQAAITGGATSITSSNLTASRALVSNASGKVAVSAVTSTELGYLDGVTSPIQTQFGNKADKSPAVLAISASKTLALSDVGVMQFCQNSSAITITIPLNSAVAFPIYTEIPIFRYGAGTVTIAATSGVVLASSGNKKSIKNQYESACLKKINTDVWVLVGSLSA